MTRLLEITVLVFLSVMTNVSKAQINSDTIQGKPLSLIPSAVPEKIFVHTDKHFYTTGEIVWFKIYLVDGLLHKPFAGSTVAYVDITDENKIPVARAKIGMSEKGGSGSILLPLVLASGNYSIRAYTNWLKNLGPQHFFEKSITIVNPLKTTARGNKKPVSATQLHLFPEGGDLVNGLPSRIAVHVTDESGLGLNGQGYLISSGNDTLSVFSTHKFGMGHFSLNPQKGLRYRVTFRIDDESLVTRELPPAVDSGYTLQVEEGADNIVNVTVRSNMVNRRFLLMVTNRDIVKLTRTAATENGSSLFNLDKKMLGEGISRITIFSEDGKPLCERLFFNRPLNVQAGIGASKQVYTNRDKVDISVNTTAADENMSLSVYLVDELEGKSETNIDHYFWLTSELKGRVEAPGYYFSGTGEEVKTATDHLMLTHGWRRFKRQDADGAEPVIKFQREHFGHFVTAKLTDPRNAGPGRNVPVFLSVPRSPQKLFTSVSDSNGLVQFEVRDYYGDGEVIVQTRPKDSFYTIEIMSPFSEVYSDYKLPVFKIVPSQQSSLLNRSISMQVQHLYIPDSLSRFYLRPVSDSLPFYGQALYSYLLDDYRRFNTMEEVLREYVREINVGVKGSGSTLRFKLFNETYREIYTDDLLVMVDGIPLADPNKVFTMDPLKLKRLDVINRNYVFGNVTFRGLVNFTSYDGLFEGLELGPRAVTVDYEGLQLQREFYSPDYSSPSFRNSRVPDLRSTLYWSPELGSRNVSFYTGDMKGRYRVVLQGLTANGHTLFASTEFTVQ